MSIFKMATAKGTTKHAMVALMMAFIISACHQKEVVKDIKLKGRTWMYLRMEFPSELTWAIDPLLQYVLNYQPSFLVFAGE